MSVSEVNSNSAQASVVLVRPEDLDAFRVGRLLLLLDTVAADAKAPQLDFERIAYYDFFAANPFLAVADEPIVERELLLAGFSHRNLSYQSSAQRFSNRRSRLQFDMAQLVALELAVAEAGDGRVTYAAATAGHDLAARMTSLYAQAYRRSVSLIVGRLRRLSDSRLRDCAKEWLRAEPFMIDIYE